jgi:ATP-dependent Clp protease protease subunit
MFEKRLPSIGMEIKFPEFPPFVTVGEINETTLKTFIIDCQKVLSLRMGFLPIVIDSYGGYVHTLLGMLDFLAHLDQKVVTIVEGKAMSAGAVLFSAGEERYIGPKSTVMIHEVSSMAWGKNTEIQNSAKEINRLNRLVLRVLDKNCGQKPGYWSSLIKKNNSNDLFMTANQCKRHKLATVIGIPHIETQVEAVRKMVL